MTSMPFALTDDHRQPARSPRSGRPTQDEAQQLGQRILSVALEHFFRCGYEHTGMDAIAAATPVSKRTLYQRYKSKRGLLLAVIEWQRDIYQTATAIPLPGGTLREKLAGLALTLLDISLSPNSLGWGRLMLEVDQIEPGLTNDVRKAAISYWRSRFRDALASDPSLAASAPEKLDFLATYFLDVLVVGPRVRILTWHELADTRQAKKAHIEQILDLAIEGVPALRPAIPIMKSRQGTKER